jgi:hypothetical protein
VFGNPSPRVRGQRKRNKRGTTEVMYSFQLRFITVDPSPTDEAVSAHF